MPCLRYARDKIRQGVRKLTVQRFKLIPEAALLAATLSLVPEVLPAQTSPAADYRETDAHALAAPASVQTSVKSLAAWLTGPCRSDEEKARAFFRWITQNIDYDVNALLSGGPMSGNAEDALRTRRGVCEGYAGLFIELAKASGIRAVKISGFAKGYGYSAGQPVGNVSNHSWNAVSIDGRWRLMDCTWGAGYIGDDRKFHRAFEPHFFFTSPREFIFDHLPEKDEWQLLDHPVSRDEFEATVHVKPGFFNLGMTLGENTAGTLHADGEIVLRFGLTHPICGIAALFEGGKSIDERSAFVQDESNLLVVRVTPQDAGEQTLRLFAKNSGDRGMYAWILDYKIISTGRGGRGPSYPRKYSAFDDGRVRLMEPFSGVLEGGTSQSFRVVVPGAEQAAVVVNDDWTFLKREGEEWTGEATIQPGSVTVCAKYPGHEQWDTLLEYRVK